MQQDRAARKRRALISVSDKSGVLDLAQGLADLGFEIVSTGGTARMLQESAVAVTGISDITGFPEMLDGRVKTLHPAVHGGILADRSKPEHLQAIADHGIGPIDLVCINLYPFEQTVGRDGVTLEEAVENIDIGGPAMIRSAAKNHASVTVLVNPADYTPALDEMRGHGDVSLETRRRLACAAYAHTAQYDALISSWLQRRFASESGLEVEFPPETAIPLRKAFDCRYGENPHQKAAFYVVPGSSEPSVATAKQIHGKELSFNNIYDLNAALETAKEFTDEEKPAAVIIKHANPCGAALGATVAEAFQKARAGDTTSAFGGILALTRPVDAAAAEAITGPNTFLEAIIAPSFDADALQILSTKRKWGANVRLLTVGDLRGWQNSAPSSGFDSKRVVGGVLLQTPDHRLIGPEDLRTATERPPTPEEVAELLFAWRVVRHVKSNAIVFTNQRMVLGVGAGQMNRVRSVRIACDQAGEGARGAVLASDAFFPFADGVEAAAEAGIRAIIQPGGSVKDEETIAAANSAGIAMVFTGVRHFLH